MVVEIGAHNCRLNNDRHRPVFLFMISQQEFMALAKRTEKALSELVKELEAPDKPKGPKTDREILLSLIASLTLCDHLGDVSSDVDTALKQAGVNVTWTDLSNLGRKLGKMGIKTLQGTSLLWEEDEE